MNSTLKTQFLAARTSLLSSSVLLIDCCSSAAFGFVVRKPSFILFFLDVLGLALLLIGVFVLVTSRHNVYPLKRSRRPGPYSAGGPAKRLFSLYRKYRWWATVAWGPVFS